MAGEKKVVAKSTTKSAAKKEVATIPLAEALKSSNTTWNYADMADSTYPVANVTVGRTKPKENNPEGSMCFEIELEGRDNVRVMPALALEWGIAEVKGDDVELTAKELTSVAGEVYGKPAFILQVAE